MGVRTYPGCEGSSRHSSLCHSSASDSLSENSAMAWACTWRHGALRMPSLPSLKSAGAGGRGGRRGEGRGESKKVGWVGGRVGLGAVVGSTSYQGWLTGCEGVHLNIKIQYKNS